MDFLNIIVAYNFYNFYFTCLFYRLSSADIQINTVYIGAVNKSKTIDYKGSSIMTVSILSGL